MSDLAEAAVVGWPTTDRRVGDRLGVPNTRWVDGLQMALALLDDADTVRNLLCVRAYEPLIELLQPTGDESAPAVLAPILEVARLDDPLTIVRCPGSQRAAVLGPKGTARVPHLWSVNDRCRGCPRTIGPRCRTAAAVRCWPPTIASTTCSPGVVRRARRVDHSPMTVWSVRIRALIRFVRQSRA